MDQEQPQDQLVDSRPRGLLLMSWQYPEYPVYERSPNWVFTMGFAGVCIVIYSLVTGNFLFALIIILTGLVVYYQARQDPQDFEMKVFEHGLDVGGNFHPYKELNKFWIIYQPPHVKRLYLEFQSTWRSHLSIPLLDQDPVKLRRLLLKYLNEDLDRDTESFSDQFSRFLKI